MNLKQRRALAKQKKRKKKQLRIVQRLLHPTDANEYFNRAIFYDQVKQYESALNDFDQAITLTRL